MSLNLRRVAAATLPIAVLASTSLTANAQQFGRIYHPFAVAPYATGATTLGGGATLPIPGYLGLSESTGVTNFGKAGSLFGYFATVSSGLNVEYCATGSGKGKGVFDATAKTVNTKCSVAASTATPAPTVFGFSPPSGTPTQTYPTLAGTDAALAQSEYTSYINDHPAPYEPVELPSIFGSIALFYNHSGVSGHANITTTALCGLYDGNIKTFGALFGTSDTTPIAHVIYRSDGSGTTFNFSNHLATVCTASPNAKMYNGSQTSTGAVSPAFSAFPSLAKAPSPLGAMGNGGVITAVKANANSIGYAEAGYLTTAIGGTLPAGTNYATVDGKDPILNLPEAANSVSSTLSTNVAVVQGSGPATTTALTGVRSGSCVKVLAPANYAKPSTGYSIVAVTYLLINSAGNGTAGEADLKNLEAIINTPSNFKNPSATAHITTIDEAEPATATGKGTTGYSSLGTGFNNALKTAANACIGA